MFIDRPMTPGEAFRAGWRDAMREELTGVSKNGKSAAAQVGDDRTWGRQVADDHNLEKEWFKGWELAQSAIFDAQSSAKFLDMADIMDLPATCGHGRIGACPHCIGVAT